MPRSIQKAPSDQPAPESEIPPAKKKFRRRRCRLERCNQLFRPTKKWQKFCCPEHKTEYHFKSPNFRKFEDEFKRLIRQMVKPTALKLSVRPRNSIQAKVKSKPEPVRTTHSQSPAFPAE